MKWVLGNALLGSHSYFAVCFQAKGCFKVCQELSGFGIRLVVSWQYCFIQNIIAYDLFDSHQLHVPVTTPNIMSQTWFLNSVSLLPPRRLFHVPSLCVGSNLRLSGTIKLKREGKLFPNASYWTSELLFASVNCNICWILLLCKTVCLCIFQGLSTESDESF